MSCLVGGGLVVKGFFGSRTQANGVGETAADSPWFFATFREDETLLLKLAKQEMGQSAPTGIAMLFAEEIGFDWDKVEVRQIEYSKETSAYYGTVFGGTTGGSSTVHHLWDAMRKAGACVRETLIRAAAERWDVDSNECEASSGRVSHLSTGRMLAYHSLGQEASRIAIPENPPLRKQSEYKIIGKPVANRYDAAIIRGAAEYASNVNLPGMVFASIERCPVLGGSLDSYDATDALRLPGVLGVEVIEGKKRADTLFRGYHAGVAVIGTSTWATMQGRKALRVNWEKGKYGSANYDTLRKQYEDREFLRREVKNDFGNADVVLQRATSVLRAEYETFFQAHASMEPLNSVASYENGSVEIWTSTQDAKAHAEAVADVLGIPVENVVLHSLVAGGSFGRRIWLDFVVESALLAKAIGRPVKVVWTREDDFGKDYYHPYKISNWEACLDDDGYISALRCDYGVVGSELFWWVLHWAYLPYGIKNVRVQSNLIEEPVLTGAWRSVTEHLQAFPEESFIDEMAYAAKEDPYQFRLKHSRRAVEQFEGDDYWRRMTIRARDVLEAATRFVDWDRSLPEGSGRGIAMSKFGSTVVAQIAEVEVKGSDYHVKKVDVIVAPGLVVNPQLAENQIEGAVVFALGALKYGKLTFENGRVREGNFDGYRILRMNEVPKISVHFLEDDGPMGGIGEPGVPALAPAVCNAIFAACGKRLRTLPATLA